MEGSEPQQKAGAVPAGLQGFQTLFSAYDPQNTGRIDKEAITEAVSSIEIPAEAQKILTKVEEHKSDKIDFESFVNIFKGVGVSDEVRQKLIHNAGKVTNVMQGNVGYHSYSADEKSAFVNVVNHHLRNDADLASILPLNPDNNDLFDHCATGILLCKLINAAVPGTIFERAINVRQNLNVFQVKENLNLAINAAKSIGCTVVSIFPESIMEKKEHLVLGLVWQIIKILTLSPINLKAHPELIKLVEEGEELSDLLKLQPDVILLRWVNYHLKNSGSPKRISNFGNDVKDSEAYTLLLHQIDPAQCDLSPLQDGDLLSRAEKVIVNSRKLGVDTFTSARDIISGNAKLNIIFAAAIFNTNPGLYATEQELYEAAGLINDDVEGTREERAFRMWINSLNIEGLYVNNLYEDVKDGLVLIKVIDKIEPGLVNWKKVELKTNNRFKKIANCNYLIELGRALHFTLIGIGGSDFTDGQKKLILGYVWQLVRHATLKLVGNMTEEAMMKWANSRVNTHATSYKDKSISNGRFLIELFSSIEPRAINWDLITPGEDPEGREQNAKYILSVARKLGSSIFCTWEDIVEVNPKMIMTLVATTYSLAGIYNRETREEVKSE
mmetsp:Transcript_6685/g.6548  ORF Transcript_6685/g.6548 Transcript_6685/m.6548 type:complete len:612 (-) Transcript_6685:35-1870(-)